MLTQEEKQLLLTDLCARLPYGVKVWNSEFLDSIEEYHPNETLTLSNLDYYIKESIEVKPYLRPMSSMTEEEKDELYTNIEWCADIDENGNFIIDKYTGSKIYRSTITGYVSWLLAHHFDFNHLIDKGLALEAPEGMYKTE